MTPGLKVLLAATIANVYENGSSMLRLSDGQSVLTNNGNFTDEVVAANGLANDLVEQLDLPGKVILDQAAFDVLKESADQIGKPPEDAKESELVPINGTWFAERAHWAGEVATLRNTPAPDYTLKNKTVKDLIDSEVKRAKDAIPAPDFTDKNPVIKKLIDDAVNKALEEAKTTKDKKE